MGRAATLAAISNDCIARVFQYVVCDEALRTLDDSIDLVCAESSHFAERIDARHEANLSLEDIPHARQHFLMKEHVADFLVGACAYTLRRIFMVKLGIENIICGSWNSAVTF
jgi:hypothetical protein